jgi:hypothetical protein
MDAVVGVLVRMSRLPDEERELHVSFDRWQKERCVLIRDTHPKEDHFIPPGFLQADFRVFNAYAQNVIMVRQQNTAPSAAKFGNPSKASTSHATMDSLHRPGTAA